MNNAVTPRPDGYHSITPSLTFKDSFKAIDFYKKAFDAVELMCMPGPGEKGVMHAEMKIGDSIMFMGDEMPGQRAQSPETLNAITGTFYLYVNDIDSAFNKAIAAGAKEVMPITEMFWGDKTGIVIDPFGYQWMLATRTRIMTPDEMDKERKEFYACMKNA